MEEVNTEEILRNRNFQLEEENNILKSDIAKLNEQIRVLSSMEVKRSDESRSDSVQAQADLIGVQMSLESANKKIEEKEAELLEMTRELEHEKTVVRSAYEKLDEVQVKLAEMEKEYKNKCKEISESTVSNSRCHVTIEELQRDLQENLDAKVALQSELKELRETVGETVKSRDKIAENIDLFYRDLTAFLSMESDAVPNAVFDQIKMIIAENDLRRGEIEKLKETLDKREESYLQTRESLKQLLSTNSNAAAGQTIEDYIRQKREIQLELDRSTLEKKELEMRKAELETNLEDTNKILEETRRILDEKEGLMSKLDLEKRESKYQFSNVGREYDMFKEALSQILGNSLSYCEASENSIKERIRKLVTDNKEKELTIQSLEQKLHNLSSQFEKNYECTKEADYKVRRTEMEYFDMRDRIKLLEKEIAARDVCRDELRGEKENFYHFLRKLAHLLKMDPYTREHDLALIFDGILNRVNQLVIENNNQNVDTNRTIQSLKKRLHELKDQLHSRDLHLELMRNKLTKQQQEMTNVLGDIEHTREEMSTESDMRDKLSKMQRRIDSLRDENKALKSEVFDLSEFKHKYQNSHQDIDTLKHNLAKLERVRLRQAEKIGELTKNVEMCDGETNQTRIVSENAVQSLTKEIRTMRGALERAKKSEQEMLDFRAVIGKILGLEVTNLAIPNYEIIRRLERLMHGSAGVTGLGGGNVTVAVPMHQHAGHTDDAARILGRRSRRSPRRPAGGHGDYGRPRSVSPLNSHHSHTQMLDPRRY